MKIQAIKSLTLVMVIVLCLQACKNSEKNTNASKTQAATTESSYDNSGKVSSATEAQEPETPKYDATAGVKENLITAQNSKMKLRVDLMEDDSYRLLTWKADKTQTDQPDKDIAKGKIVDEGSWGRAMSFTSEGVTYQLTDYSPAGDPSVNLILKKGGNLVESTILKTSN